MSDKNGSDQGAMVPVSDADFTVAPNVDLSDTKNDIWTTLDRSTEEGRAMLGYVLTTEPTRMEDHVGKAIKVTDVTTTLGEVTNEDTGEVRKCIRSLLLCTDGTVYSTMSPVVAKGLQRVIAIEGVPPWPDGKELIINEEKTRNQRKCLTVKLPTPPAFRKGKNEKS